MYWEIWLFKIFTYQNPKWTKLKGDKNIVEKIFELNVIKGRVH